MHAAGEIALSDPERAVLATVLREGETTRPALGRALLLSPPTVASAIARLIERRLIAPLSTRQGARGRAATVYGTATTAGWTFGLDLGSTQVHVHAQGIDGRSLIASSVDLSRSDVDEATAAIHTLMKRVRRAVGEANGPLYAVGVALPRIISDYLEHGTSQAHGTPDVATLTASLGLPPGIPVLLENNVNCAALAEMELGVARGHEDFVYLQIGVGIGAGIISNKRVVRGARGGAGEVSALPVGWPAQSGSDPFELEKYLGSAGLLSRLRHQWPGSTGPAPASVPELFRLAERGNPVAQRAITQHAGDIGQLARTLTAVIDPSLIVLGGGVGRNPLLTPGVRDAVQHHHPDVQVVVSELGESATVDGAVALTVDHALDKLLGTHHQRRLDDRTTFVLT